MNTTMLPEIGQWYQPVNKGRIFQVVAVDAAERLIEIQKYDGDIDELEFNEWYAAPLRIIDPPEDCSGPMDDIEQDVLDDNNDELHTQKLPLSSFDSITAMDEDDAISATVIDN